jgi:hypothetical protein
VRINSEESGMTEDGLVTGVTREWRIAGFWKDTRARGFVRRVGTENR